MRRNVTDINEQSQKHLVKIGEGPTLREFPSQSELGVFIRQDDSLERAKLAAHVNSLEAEVMNYKRQGEAVN